MEKQDWQDKGAGHRQRLRDKFHQRGIDALNDDEVLELLITMGTPRRDCKDTARAALKQFGSLANVFATPPAALQKVKGLGPANSFAISFVHAIARRYLQSRLPGRNYLHSSQQVAEFLSHAMRDLEKEIFKAVFLDAGNGIIAVETVSTGTITSNTVYPREIIKQALHHNAAGMVIAHNHPSGRTEPSVQDKHLTRHLFLAMNFMNIRLLDHLIIGHAAQPFSFADHGLMAAIRDECQQLIQF